MSNLIMTRGDSVDFNFALSQGGVAINLTGAAIIFTAKNALTDPDDLALIQKSIGSGITVTNVSGGLFTISLDPEDTKDFEFATYCKEVFWDVQVTLQDTSVHTIASGLLRINADVSRA